MGGYERVLDDGGKDIEAVQVIHHIVCATVEDERLTFVARKQMAWIKPPSWKFDAAPGSET